MPLSLVRLRCYSWAWLTIWPTTYVCISINILFQASDISILYQGTSPTSPLLSAMPAVNSVSLLRVRLSLRAALQLLKLENRRSHSPLRRWRISIVCLRRHPGPDDFFHLQRRTTISNPGSIALFLKCFLSFLISSFKKILNSGMGLLNYGEHMELWDLGLMGSIICSLYLEMN